MATINQSYFSGLKFGVQLVALVHLQRTKFIVHSTRVHVSSVCTTHLVSANDERVSRIHNFFSKQNCEHISEY